MTGSPDDGRAWRRVCWVLGIALVSATLGTLVSWRAPGLDLYARDWLMRARGPLPPPNDIVIVAIDEASIGRYGRFPWPRSVIAHALAVIADAHPKAIAVDVLFSEPTNARDDATITEAIKRAGNVVSAAELITAASGEVVWLRPLAAIERASAGIGHVNVSTELEGVARELLAQQADSQGNSLWAMPVETIRVGDGASENSVSESRGTVRVGSYSVLVEPQPSTIPIESRDSGEVRRLTAQRMTIDYIGPARSFAPYTFSLADLIEGHVQASQLAGKYILIGATAASLGDRVASPFIHMDGMDYAQHGSLMPGVEVLANAMNTILRSRFYRKTPDWLTFACGMLIALLVTSALSVGHLSHEAVKQVVLLSFLGTLLLVSAYLAFTRWLLIPPLVTTLISFATAAPLTLVRRAMVASAGLDERVRELARAELWLWPATAAEIEDPAPLIAKLTGASAVAIFVRGRSRKARYSLLSSYGAPVIPSLAKGEPGRLNYLRPDRSSVIREPRTALPSLYFQYSSSATADVSQTTSKFCLGTSSFPLGVLVLAHSQSEPPNSDLLRLCIVLATSYGSRRALETPEASREGAGFSSVLRRYLPRGVEWKARTLGILNRKLLARARFVDRAIRSVEDGLVVGGLDGRIVVVNRRATDILGLPEAVLLGSDMLEKLGERDDGAKDTLIKLFHTHTPIEREIVLGERSVKHYNLRLSPVLDDTEEPVVAIGLVASLSDITTQHELQQTKTDVMALVTHELRTPLTAIQGISEVLTQFEVDPPRRREMHTAINDEARRLARMIDEYLDITKLESGVRPLRLAPVRLESLVDRALLLLDPVAAKRDITIARRFLTDLPTVLVDADLLARAVTNLVANAIKYSPVETEVTVSLSTKENFVILEVRDQGYGIPPEHLKRIFEKFYRIPRVEYNETPGTGLGLALVSEIVDQHNGSITVHSALNMGTTFTLQLPILAGRSGSGGELRNDV